MILFEIFAKPVVQKQTRFSFKSTRRTYDPSCFEKQALIWQMRPYAPKEPILGPFEVDLTFYLGIPKDASKSLRRAMLDGLAFPIRRPDIDNLAYLITNAMKQLFYRDDSQIVDLLLHKRYGEEPKTVVKLIPKG